MIVRPSRIVKDDTMKEIAENSHQQDIKDLTLCTFTINSFKSCVSPRGMHHFSLGRWDTLVQLEIWADTFIPKIGNIGCKYLSRVPLPNIKFITLGHCDIDNYGILHLTKRKWKQLKDFYLNFNKIGKEAMKILTKSNWKRLEKLDISNNKQLTNEKDAKQLMLLSNRLLRVHRWSTGKKKLIFTISELRKK